MNMQETFEMIKCETKYILPESVKLEETVKMNLPHNSHVTLFVNIM